MAEVFSFLLHLVVTFRTANFRLLTALFGLVQRPYRARNNSLSRKISEIVSLVLRKLPEF